VGLHPWEMRLSGCSACCSACRWGDYQRGRRSSQYILQKPGKPRIVAIPRRSLLLQMADEKLHGLGLGGADALVNLSEVTGAYSKPASRTGKTAQEKRRCPECGTQVGPRYGTGKDGEGTKCPGTKPDGFKCQYIFSAGKRKQQHLELMQQCVSVKESKLTDVKGAFQRASRKVMKEAARTGGSAILLWYNVLEERIADNKELGRMVRKTTQAEARQIPVKDGEYAYQATSVSGTVEKCGVVFHYDTGTETASTVMQQISGPVNILALKNLKEQADKAMLASVTGAASDSSAGPTAAPQELEDLEAFLKAIGQHDGCFEPLSKNGLTLEIMKAIVTANKGEMPPFVDALKVVGLTAGQAMVLFAHIKKL